MTTSFLHNGVTGHRGNPEECPQNTLPGFQNAMDMGADWLELDVHRSRDGKLMVIHDADTEYVTGEKHLIAETDSAALQRLNVAAYFNRKTGGNRFEPIPFLEDVLALVKTQRRTRLSIQPKMDCVEEIVQLLREWHMEEYAGFNDGCLGLMIKAKTLLPQAHIFWDTDGSNEIETDVETARKYGFGSMVVYYENLTREKVAKINAAGLESGAWNVNAVADLERLLDWGVYRIYSDRPRVFMNLKKERHLI